MEKIPISQGLVTLLHIRGVLPTLQLETSPETPCRVPEMSHRALISPRWYPRIEQHVFECFTMFNEYFTIFYKRFTIFYSVFWCFTSFIMFYECFTIFYECITMFCECFTMFYECFTIFHGCFTMFYECFMMFYKCSTIFNNVVWCLGSHVMIRNCCISACNITNRCRDRQKCHKSDPMLNLFLTGVCSFSVPGRQFPNGLWLASRTGNIYMYFADFKRFWRFWKVVMCACCFDAFLEMNNDS